MGDDYYNNAVYGYTSDGTLGADMLNPAQASDGNDWGSILASGIRGAAQGAIAARVSGAYQSGQLQQQAVQQQKANGQFMVLLIVGGLLYLASKG